MSNTHSPSLVAPAITDLIGGQVQLYFALPISVFPYVKSGRLKAIGVGISIAELVIRKYT